MRGLHFQSVPKEKIHTCEYFLISLNVVPKGKGKRDLKKKKSVVNHKNGVKLFIIIF